MKGSGLWVSHPIDNGMESIEDLLALRGGRGDLRAGGSTQYSNLSLLRNWLLGTAELDLLQFLVCF